MSSTFVSRTILMIGDVLRVVVGIVMIAVAVIVIGTVLSLAVLVGAVMTTMHAAVALVIGIGIVISAKLTSMMKSRSRRR